MADVFCVIECCDQCPLVGRFIPEICFKAKTIEDSTNTDQIFWRVKSYLHEMHYELNWINWTYCFAFVEFVRYSRFLFLAQIESCGHICCYLHKKFQNNLQEYKETCLRLLVINYSLSNMIWVVVETYWAPFLSKIVEHRNLSNW